MSIFSVVDPWPLIAAIIAIICAGAVQGSTGFGFNMLAAPILVVIDPVFVPAPMLLMALLVSAGGMIREFSSVDRIGLRFALGGRLISSALAVLCLGLLDEGTFAMVFAVLVLLAVGLSIAGFKLKASPRNLFAAGSISGFMGTLTSIGAPPMAMVYQLSTGPVMRATLSAYFVFGAAISLIALGVAGHITRADILLALALTPVAFIGFFFSNWLKEFVDRGRVGRVILFTSTASAILLVVKYLY